MTTQLKAKHQASTNSANVPSRDMAAQVSKLIADFLHAHQRMLLAVQAHRDAVRRASLDDMAQALNAQQALMEEIAALEATRTALAKVCAGNTLRSGPITLSDMAKAVEPLESDARDFLLAQVSELRIVMTRVRTEQSALGQAAMQLATHVDSLMRLVVQKLSTAGVYGRTGRVDAHRAALAVDMRS
ncbi:MAG: flagellar export chaperone FlgN [Planctomycetes bacterium]|nr:flagellar export chaperone FlgN [Planctomycetota bacterium]